MEKSGSPKCRSGGWQPFRLVLVAVAVVTWGTFDQVLAAPVKRVFSPHEFLNHSQFGSGVIQGIASRSNAALHGDSMYPTYPSSKLDEHALRPDLAGTQGRQMQKLPLVADGLAGVVMKGNVVDLHQQMTPSRTAHILDSDSHRQRIPSLDYILPLVDQGNTNDYAPRPHALIKISGEYAQVLGRNFVGASSKGIGLGSALVGLAGGFQAFIRDSVGLARYIDTDLGKPDAVNGSFQPLARLMKAYQKADRADQGEQDLRPGEKCYLPGPLGCSPLSAKIGATLVCGLIAWGLIFRIFDLLDRRRRNWLLIIPLGTIAATMYLLPSYLVVGFPWNW